MSPFSGSAWRLEFRSKNLSDSQRRFSCPTEARASSIFRDRPTSGSAKTRTWMKAAGCLLLPKESISSILATTWQRKMSNCFWPKTALRNQFESFSNWRPRLESTSSSGPSPWPCKPSPCATTSRFQCQKSKGNSSSNSGSPNRRNNRHDKKAIYQ